MVHSHHFEFQKIIYFDLYRYLRFQSFFVRTHLNRYHVLSNITPKADLLIELQINQNEMK